MENDNKLKKVKDLATILSLLNGAKIHTSEAYVWRIIGQSKHLAQIKIEAIRKLRKDFCIAPAEGQELVVEELIGGQDFIDIYIPDSALLLRCLMKTADPPKRYYLAIPEFVAQVDRRQSFRLNVYESTEVKLNFSKSITLIKTMSQSFHKDCFDISTGGFSFFVSRMELKFFKENDPISTVEIKAGNWMTRVQALISTIREVEPDEFNGLPYKVWRISCRIIEIDQISRKYLEKFIFERIKNELSAINES